MPHRRWNVGESVLSTDFNPNVADQVAAQYADSAARATDWPSPVAGAVSVLTPNSSLAGLETYIGGAWRRPWSLPWGLVDYQARTSNLTVNAETVVLTSSATYTANRRLRISAQAVGVSTSSAIILQLSIRDSNISGTLLQQLSQTAPAANQSCAASPWVLTTSVAGTHAYVLTAITGSPNGQITATASAPCVFMVEDVGPAGAPA